MSAVVEEIAERPVDDARVEEVGVREVGRDDARGEEKPTLVRACGRGQGELGERRADEGVRDVFHRANGMRVMAHR